MYDLIVQSFFETLWMVGSASFFSVIIGVPLGLLLTLTAKGGLYEKKWVCQASNIFINVLRSIPYIILTVLFIPFTRFIVGSSIGTAAAVVPLTIAGFLLIARVTEEALRQIPPGLLEVGRAAGATKRQIITTILLPESLPSLIAGMTTVVVNIIGFSAMAGAMGGGGLGDLAIRYGYQRYDIQLIFIIVCLLIMMVQLVQSLGNYLVRRLTP